MKKENESKEKGGGGEEIPFFPGAYSIGEIKIGLFRA